MIGALVACSLIVSLCQNNVSAQEVLDVGEVGGDDKIVFPGGEEIDAINEIIEDLVNSEELKLTKSSTNDSDSSIVRTTTGLKYIITNVPTSVLHKGCRKNLTKLNVVFAIFQLISIHYRGLRNSLFKL